MDDYIAKIIIKKRVCDMTPKELKHMTIWLRQQADSLDVDHADYGKCTLRLLS